MNQFLESLEITFRRDPNNFRPRINKLNSVKVSVENMIRARSS
jgi:ATP-binding cassette subfamily E protein 1